MKTEMSQPGLVGDDKATIRSPSPDRISCGGFQQTAMPYSPEALERLQTPKPNPKPVRTLGNPTPL